MKNINKLLYIILFAVLFGIVAFSSFWHAVEFFGLANSTWMSGILAFAFEVGQAAVLFALLTSESDRKKIMPWVLMTMFTVVQVLGNVYASYKHIILNSVENLRFFKEPVFIWTSLPDDQATVIITYLVGGILPISSLLLTGMLTSFLSRDKSGNILEAIPEPTPELVSGQTQESPDAVPELTPELITDAAPEPISSNDKQTHIVSL